MKVPCEGCEGTGRRMIWRDEYIDRETGPVSGEWRFVEEPCAYCSGSGLVDDRDPNWGESQ